VLLLPQHLEQMMTAKRVARIADRCEELMMRAGPD